MRAILLVLILAVVATIVVLATGLVDITTTRGARAPNVEANSNGVTARGGQAPAFDVETGSVTVGTRRTTVPMPTLQVNPADSTAGVTNNSAAAPATGAQ